MSRCVLCGIETNNDGLVCSNCENTVLSADSETSEMSLTVRKHMSGGKKAIIILASVFGGIILIVIAISIIGMFMPNIDSPSYEVEAYISDNISEFSGCQFDTGVNVQDIGNSEYQVMGTMSDHGAWSHKIVAIIQESPNNAEFVMCSLIIDGQTYVTNPPRQ